MRSTNIALSLVVVALASAACGSSPTTPTLTTSTTTSTVTLINEVLTGTVPVPVDGVLQSAQNTFVVGQGGGSVAITLTSAVETLPDGTFLPTVTMGLGVGTLTGDTCTLLSGAFTPAQASGTAQLTGSLGAGTYCLQVSDVSNQLGPVLYAVAVSHP